MQSSVPEIDLLDRLSEAVKAAGGTITSREAHALIGTLTAIQAKWLLGGRKVTSNIRCTLDSAKHEAHFRESAVESSWGLPPPTFTVQTTSQYGSRVKESRVDKSVGGGGRLEFGKFRESVEQAVKDAGWGFVLEVV
jgi:hypothetical protein